MLLKKEEYQNKITELKSKIQELKDKKKRFVKEELENITKVLYAQARLIEGLPIDNPTELTNLICDELSK